MKKIFYLLVSLLFLNSCSTCYQVAIERDDLSKVNCCLEKDGDLPEMDYIINLLKNSSMPDAEFYLQELLNKNEIKPTTLAKVYYNLALVQLYSGKFQEAANNFLVAEMIEPKNENYSKWLSLVEKEIDYKRGN